MIAHLQDEVVIRQIEQIFNDNPDWWNLINDDEKNDIDEGLA